MSVQSIPTFRAAHLLPYLEFLQKMGAPIDRALHKFQLPTIIEDQPEMRLPLVPAIKFLSSIERTEGIPDLGSLCSDQVTIKLLNPATIRSILSAPTLGAALQTFTRSARLESSVVEAWMVASGSEIKLFKAHRISWDQGELRTMKLHFMLLFIAIIRAFAGAEWAPRMMALRSPSPLCPFAAERFPSTRLLFGQDASWIEFPKNMLCLQNYRNRNSRSGTPACISQAEPIPSFVDDFATSLKCVLKAYLSDGYPSVELAAGIVGTSVRTLQRNLAQSDLTYSKLVEHARFEVALEMLGNTHTKVIDVAYAVGYADPAHFSRAFRRMAGISPHGFRMSEARLS